MRRHCLDRCRFVWKDKRACSVVVKNLCPKWLVANGLLPGVAGTFNKVYGALVLVAGTYLVSEVATKAFHIQIEGEEVLFRRMGVLMWERDVFTRLAEVLVQRERGEIGVFLNDGKTPDRTDGFRMFSRGPEENMPPLAWQDKLLRFLRYDEVCDFYDNGVV